MTYDIVSYEGDLDHCVEPQMNVYIVLRICVDVEETTGQLGV